MQDHDTRLDAVVLWGGHGHRADCVLLRVVFDPPAHVPVHERPHFRWPGLDANAGAFALVQGDDELGPLAVGDVEGPGFPWMQCGHSGGPWGRFVRVGLWDSEPGFWRNVRCSTARTLALPVGGSLTLPRAELLLTAAAAMARCERLTAPATAQFEFAIWTKLLLLGAERGRLRLRLQSIACMANVGHTVRMLQAGSQLYICGGPAKWRASHDTSVPARRASPASLGTSRRPSTNTVRSLPLFMSS
jgi:hypothetical protein